MPQIAHFKRGGSRLITLLSSGQGGQTLQHELSGERLELESVASGWNLCFSDEGWGYLTATGKEPVWCS
eukprot:2263526-Amphidinium_carterae.1